MGMTKLMLYCVVVNADKMLRF